MHAPPLAALNRSGRVIQGCLTALLIWCLIPVAASAAPTLERSAPFDGEILLTTPTSVSATFSEPLDADVSSLTVLDIRATLVAGTSSEVSDDGRTIHVTLPVEFADGVYTVAWNVTAAESGESASGWTSFSVGNPEDAAVITIPTTTDVQDGPPAWLQTGTRWAALIGVIVTSAIWPIWRTVLRPTIGTVWRRGVRATFAMQQAATTALIVAFAGSILELLVRTQSAGGEVFLDNLTATLADSSWGRWWLARIGLLIALGIGLALANWWYPQRNSLKNVTLWALSVLVPLPVAMTSQSAQDSAGRATSIASDYVHLASASLWAGSTVLTLAILRSLLSGTTTPESRAIGRSLGLRLGWVTMVALLLLAITGTYQGFLLAGNTSALIDTPFGQALLIKLALTFGAIVLLTLISRGLRRLDSQHQNRRVWLLLAAQALVLLGVLLGTAQMNTTDPARDLLERRATQQALPVAFEHRDATFLIAPGSVGVNHLRLEVPGEYLQSETEAFVVASSPDHPELGEKWFQMYRVTGNAFEHHGTELSLLGDWDLRLVLREPGFDDLTYDMHLPIEEENRQIDVPGMPWRFESTGGLSGLLLLVIGTMGGVTAILTGSKQLRKEAGGLGLASLALGTVLILQAQLDPILAVSDDAGAIDPDNLAMVARGEEIYLQNCATCHGADLRGDGPASGAMNPPPADFAAPHTFVHSDEDLIFWIRNGKQGTAMPGFGTSIDDQQMRDVVAFIQNWQQNYDPNADPDAGIVACRTDAVSVDMIPTLFNGQPSVARGESLTLAADPNVDPYTSNDVIQTIEQVIACGNEGSLLRTLPLFTPAFLNERYPDGPDALGPIEALATPQADESAPMTIREVQSASLLADGRVAVTVSLKNEDNRSLIPGVEPTSQLTLILINDGGTWRIDEMR